MHHIYHTKAIILSSRNIGEANKIFSLYTRELGMIRAIAQGVRLNKSKLRFSLQDFSYVNIDLVRGRDIWRITSASYVNSFPFARGNKESIFLIARVSKLLERLCQGEVVNEIIFDDFVQALYLLDSLETEKSSILALELHVVLRILNSLGYVDGGLLLKDYLSSPFDFSKVDNLLKEKQSIIAHINKALNESQL